MCLEETRRLSDYEAEYHGVTYDQNTFDSYVDLVFVSGCVGPNQSAPKDNGASGASRTNSTHWSRSRPHGLQQTPRRNQESQHQNRRRRLLELSPAQPLQLQ